MNKIILVIDEAHNLPETAVEIASDSLTVFTLRQAQLEAERLRRRDAADFASTFRALIERISARAEKESYVSPLSLIEELTKASCRRRPAGILRRDV